MNNQQRIRQMHQRLEVLEPSHVDITDDSHKHIGHAGAKDGRGHFTLIIASPLLANKSVIEQHKMIYRALDDMMQTDIHALSITIEEL